MEEKLVSAIRKKLEEKGTTSKIRSEFEYEILSLLGLNGLQQEKSQHCTSRDNIVDELVADYLEWIGYNFTSAVFQSESNLGDYNAKLERARVSKRIGLECFNDRLPLLCQLIDKVKQCNEE